MSLRMSLSSRAQHLATTRRFSRSVLAAVGDSRIIGIRAGIRPHRFIGIWAVVVNGRFKVEAFDAGGLIGEGAHTRAVVSSERLVRGALSRNKLT
jgi:hypothetical protein